jgi:hypothetical protein
MRLQALIQRPGSSFAFFGGMAFGSQSAHFARKLRGQVRGKHGESGLGTMPPQGF